MRDATAAKDYVVINALVVVLLFFISAVSSGAQSDAPTHENRVTAETRGQTERNKAIIQRMFRDLFERDAVDEQAIARYFGPSYVQKSDGTTLDFAGFVDHVREVKKSLTNMKVTFEQMVAEGNKVMEIHVVEADLAATEKRAGGKIKVRLITLWEIRDGKIVLCDELSHLEQGPAEDRDLGSRTSKP
jgi:predicted SnoaL-like aldol condensation-catalyzing enzyme